MIDQLSVSFTPELIQTLKVMHEYSHLFEVVDVWGDLQNTGNDSEQTVPLKYFSNILKVLKILKVSPNNIDPSLLNQIHGDKYEGGTLIRTNT